MWSWTTQIFLGLLAVGVLLFLYIFAFIFIAGSTPKGANYDSFVMNISSPKGEKEFLLSVLTWGYFKRSFKFFVQYYRRKFFPVEIAALGKRCPDAKLIALDGSVKSLLDHFVNVDPSTPLILNMGSYT
jgi:hypothetical protein